MLRNILIPLLILLAAPLSRGAGDTLAVPDITTMTCTFTQVKELSLIDETVESSGRMAFVAPDRLSWEYTEPYTYKFILDGDRVHVGTRDRNSTFDTRTNRMFRLIADIMVESVTGRIVNDSRDFDVKVTDSSGPDTVTLTVTPRRKELSRLITRFTVTASRSTGLVSAIVITEKNGDATRITLHDVTLNRPVDETAFARP